MECYIAIRSGPVWPEMAGARCGAVRCRWGIFECVAGKGWDLD